MPTQTQFFIFDIEDHQDSIDFNLFEFPTDPVVTLWQLSNKKEPLIKAQSNSFL